jgi:hypothetical protein
MYDLPEAEEEVRRAKARMYDSASFRLFLISLRWKDELADKP